MLADVVNGADVGVVEGGGSPGLAPEPFQGLVGLEPPLGQELQRDLAVQVCVLGLVDDGHAAAAQLLAHAVVRDGLADHWGCKPLESPGSGRE